MTLEDLDKMNVEFPPLAKELMDDAADRLNKEVGTKINAIREQELLISKKSSDLKSRFSAAFLSGLHRTIQIVETERQQQDSAVSPSGNKSGLQRTTTLNNLNRRKSMVGFKSKSNVYSGKKRVSDAYSGKKSSLHTEENGDGGKSAMRDSFSVNLNDMDAKSGAGFNNTFTR